MPPPVARLLLDVRKECGRWLMTFHTDRDSAIVHTGIVGLVWSEDLEDSVCP